MKQVVRNIVEQAAAGVPGVSELDALPGFEVEVPKAAAHGDLATNLAMVLARPLRRNPREIAAALAEGIRGRTDLFEAVEVAGPGFINFRFAPSFWQGVLRPVLGRDRAWLRPDLGRGRRVQVEFVSANPTGPLHVGHGRGAALGLALSNLLEAAGYEVEREFYVNDAGRQVRLLGASVHARYLERLGEPSSMPEDGYHGEYVRDLAAALHEEAGDRYRGRPFDACADEISAWACGRMLERIRKDLEDFGVRFDHWASEKALFDDGRVEAALGALEEAGQLYEKDGARWFRSSAFEDEKDRVVVKADGDTTYFASDIAYHKDKLDRGYDEIIDIWGADHHGYVPRIASVLRAFGYDRTRFRVLLVQIVNLLRGGEPVKMSKRAGEFVTLRELMDDVGPDIVKFIFLTRRSDSHLDFDIETARAESSENPVFYVQYAHARINSIFRLAPERGYAEVDAGALAGAAVERLAAPGELALMKVLARYPEVFETAVRLHEPHRMTFFLQELAAAFHGFYREHRVLLEDDRELGLARLALVRAVEIVLHEGLGLLGVRAPERM